MKRVTIEQADDKSFIVRCSRPAKDKKSNMPVCGDYEEDTYTAKDIDDVVEILNDKFSGEDEPSEKEEYMKAWNKEAKKGK